MPFLTCEYVYSNVPETVELKKQVHQRPIQNEGGPGRELKVVRAFTNLGGGACEI